MRLAWNELYQIGAVPIPWVEPDKAAPVKKLEGTKEKENSISEQQLPLSDVVGLNIDSLFSADPNRGGENLVDFFGDDVLGDLDHVSSNNYDPPSIFSCNFEDDFLNSPLLSRIAVENVKDGDHCNPFFEFDDERNQTPARSINTPIKTSPSVNTTPRSQPDHRARRKKKSNPTQKVVGRSHTPIKKKPTRLLREMQVNNPRSDAESLVSESPVGSHYRLDSNGIFQDEGTPSCNSFEADAEAVMLVRRKKSTPKKLTPNPGPNKQIHTPIRKFKITKRERSSSQNKRTPKKIKFQKDKSPKHVPSVQFANLYGLSSTDDDYEPVTEPHAKVENMIMESNEVLPLGKNGQGKLRKLPTRLASDSIQGPGNLAAKVLKHRRSFAHNTLSL